MKLLLLGLGVLVAGTVPLLPDPYYHGRRICLFLWIAREIEEVYTGERHAGDHREGDPTDSA